MLVNPNEAVAMFSLTAVALIVVTFPEPLGVEMDRLATSGDPNRFISMLRKEQGLIEAGLEMIDQMQMSLSGNAAKDKRSQLDSKRPFKTATKKLKPEGILADAKGSKDDRDKSKGPTLVSQANLFKFVYTLKFLANC